MALTAFTSLGIAYILGGLTFLPLILSLCFLHAYWTSARYEATPTTVISRDGDLPDHTDDESEKLQKRSNEPDVAANYFAVCREYVPGGVNGKPPERTTAAGETITAESPSVYQSMYRSLFDRNRAQVPTIDGGKTVRKARNVLFVVLRFAARSSNHMSCSTDPSVGILTFYCSTTRTNMKCGT